jgi:protein-S-isoprenylcysteine O-methyltransferase Ste14
LPAIERGPFFIEDDTMIADMRPYLILMGLWIVWCGLHSWMISTRFMNWLKHHWPSQERYYRLVFNGVAALTLIPVVWFGSTIGDRALFSWNGGWHILQAFIGLTAGYLFYAGAQQYDLKRLLGLRQFQNDTSACEGIGSDCRISEMGILGKIRHPWYTAGMLIIWIRDLSWSVLCANLVIICYFVVGTHLEEKKLHAAFGNDYLLYRRKVPKFFPRP